MALTPDQDAAMRKSVEGVYKDVASRVGQPLIDEFLKETRGATNQDDISGLPCFGGEALSIVRVIYLYLGAAAAMDAARMAQGRPDGLTFRG